MTVLQLPTAIPQHRPPSSHHPAHTAVFQTVYHRGGDNDDGKVWPPACTLPPGCYFPALIVCPALPSECLQPPYLPSHASTWSPSGTLPISTTTQTVTQIATPSGPGPASTSDPTTTMPVSSSGFPGMVVPDNRGLSTGQLAGVIVGSVSGVLLLLVFLWLFRRGAFGSGTLFGFRYGDARKPGWGEARQEMRQKGKAGYSIGVSGEYLSFPCAERDPLGDLGPNSSVFLSGARLTSPSFDGWSVIARDCPFPSEALDAFICGQRAGMERTLTQYRARRTTFLRRLDRLGPIPHRFQAPLVLSRLLPFPVISAQVSAATPTLAAALVNVVVRVRQRVPRFFHLRAHPFPHLLRLRVNILIHVRLGQLHPRIGAHLSSAPS